MLLFILTATLVWLTVLTFFVVRDFRLLFKITRWAITIYLVVFGLLAAEVLREGLVVNGAPALHWDARLAWAIWYLLVAAAIADWRFLIPAAILPVWVLGFPEARTLLNFGLVRLGWLEAVHNPLAFAIKRGGGLEGVIWARECVDEAVERVGEGWMARLARRVLEGVAVWVPWGGEDLEKLRPAERWNGVLLGEWWRFCRW